MNQSPRKPPIRANEASPADEAVLPPVFIHSLFRSGSTWLFDVFRRAEAGYWCYQEPFHEELRRLNSNPDALLAVHTDMARSMRHPALERPYFYEFHAIREHIGDSFQPCISYASFFDPSICPAFDDYTSRLIRHAQGRPVLQCCRSFGRVAHLRQQYGGVHIYLWRNPWDQWWSYQINDYFDARSLAILHACNAPPVIKLLRDELSIDNELLRGHEDDFSRLDKIPMSLESRYLAFYGLWLFSLIENRPQADVDINIDQLATDAEYRARVTTLLRDCGVTGLDFSTCAVPQAQFGSDDKEFFGLIERRVQQLFAIAGYDITVLHDVIRLQALTQPAPAAQSDTAMRDAMRSRGVARRYAHHAFVATRQRVQTTDQLNAVAHERDAALAKAGAAEALAQQAERQAQAAEIRANQAEALAGQAKTQALAAETRTARSFSERDAALAKADQLHSELMRLYASKSWRATLPLRRGMRFLKSVLRPPALVMMRWVLRHSRIRAVFRRLLGPFPWVTAQLRALARHRGLLEPTGSPVSPEGQHSTPLESGSAEVHPPKLSAEEIESPAADPREPTGPAMSSRTAEIYARLLAMRASKAFRGYD